MTRGSRARTGSVGEGLPLLVAAPIADVKEMDIGDRPHRGGGARASWICAHPSNSAAMKPRARLA
jgi:hypothetical protein